VAAATDKNWQFRVVFAEKSGKNGLAQRLQSKEVSHPTTQSTQGVAK
jgi:hypothetical protein